MISRELLKIHSNRLAQANKQYYDANGDLYLGTSDSRLILFKKANAGGNVVQPTQHINVDTTSDALTDEELRASPVDVNIVSDESTDSTEVIETLNQAAESLESISEDLDMLTMAMDKKNMSPIYVEDINGPIKKDIFNAIVSSDGIGPFSGRSSATNNVIFQIETTGYSSFVVQTNQAASTIVTGSYSVDGVNWINAVVGTSNTANAVVGSITLTSSIIAVYACPGKYFRLISGSAGQWGYTGYLKREPLSAFFNLLGSSPVNMNYINGAAPLSMAYNTATRSASAILGGIVVGANFAPDAATVPYPIMVGGNSLPEVGALSGKVKRFLTDTDGRLTVSSPNSPNYKNNQSLNVQDTTIHEDKTQIEIMWNILEELKTLNLYMKDLPMMLNKGLEFNEL